MGELILILSDGESLELVLSEGGGAVTPPYEGEYAVTSALHEDRTLETGGKRMTEDMIVRQIPVTRTTNPYGGQTVVIG